MIERRYVSSRDVTKIAFEHPAGVDADAIEPSADLHGGTPLARSTGSGTASGSSSMSSSRAAPRSSATACIAVAGDSWNDADADGLVPNDQGSQNAVAADGSASWGGGAYVR